MSLGLIRNLVFARAMSVEPIVRALWPDPLEPDARPFARSNDRWRQTAMRAQRAGSASDADESEIINHRGTAK